MASLNQLAIDMVISVLNLLGIGILLFSAKTVRKIDQLGRRRLHGQGILLGVESLEWGGVADEDLGKLPRQASRGGDGPCLDTLADMQLEAAAAGGGALGDVDRDGLRVGASRPAWLKALGWRGRHCVVSGNGKTPGGWIWGFRRLLSCAAGVSAAGIPSMVMFQRERGAALAGLVAERSRVCLVRVRVSRAKEGFAGHEAGARAPGVACCCCTFA